MSYLRLSVTDRCNFRCQYCSPALWGGIKDLLSAEEIERIVSLFARVGIRKVRLTGGEPLMRPDLVEIAQRVRAVPGISRLAITTNASRLSTLAIPIRDAGVNQLNISLDTLRDEVFRGISPRGALSTVIEGIDAAADAGFEILKMNTVVMRGVNEDQIAELVAFAHARKMVPRFIELMPFGKGTGVPTGELLERLRTEGLEPVPEDPSSSEEPLGPARYYRVSSGRVGFISPITGNFCAGCNRVRVASNGDLRACLGGREQAPLSKLIRGGAEDEELIAAIRRALGNKPEGHRFTEPGASTELLPMMGIGG